MHIQAGDNPLRNHVAIIKQGSRGDASGDSSANSDFRFIISRTGVIFLQ
jgi:hypothetical protein